MPSLSTMDSSPLNLMSSNAQSNYMLQPSLFDQESTPQATDINQLQFMKQQQMNMQMSPIYTTITNNIFEPYNEPHLDYAPSLDHQMASYQTPHFSAKPHPQLICSLPYSELIASEDQVILNTMKSEDDLVAPNDFSHMLAS